MKAIDKHSNYGYYSVCSSKAHKIEETRLNALVEMVRDKCNGKGFVRFMLVSDTEEPMCILYADFNGKEKLTKLITLSELEDFLKNT